MYVKLHEQNKENKILLFLVEILKKLLKEIFVVLILLHRNVSQNKMDFSVKNSLFFVIAQEDLI